MIHYLYNSLPPSAVCSSCQLSEGVRRRYIRWPCKLLCTLLAECALDTAYLCIQPEEGSVRVCLQGEIGQ